jgi:probable addiction module antidote protein
MADSPEVFLNALRKVAEAHKMAKVAEEAGVSRESLYKTLSEDGNPRFDTLNSVLDAIGITLTVELKHSPTVSTDPRKITETIATVTSGVIPAGSTNLTGGGIFSRPLKTGNSLYGFSTVQEQLSVRLGRAPSEQLQLVA